MDALYRQCIQEKQYIENVSQATLDGYRWAWRAFEPALSGKSKVTKADITERIACLRQRGLSPVSIKYLLPQFERVSCMGSKRRSRLGLVENRQVK